MKQMAGENPINLLSGLLNSVHINTIESTTRTHEVFLDSEIEEPAKYRELISLLINAGENDRIHLFINSNGGHLDSAGAIISGILATNAEVTAFLMGACHSAASLIAMYCHNVHVFDTAYIMIHTASFGSSGNTPTVKAHTDFTIKQCETLMIDAYEGFLNPKELEKVLNGIELWFNAEEIKPRLRKRMEAVEAQDKAREAKAIAAEIEAAKPKQRKPKVKVKVEDGAID
jgi:ATP-dependent protease ClpP protease subunit